MIRILISVFICFGTNIFSTNYASSTDFKFADKETAIKILTADDEYLNNMKAIEIALPVGPPTASKTIDDLKEHYSKNVLEWPESEKALMKALIVTHKKKLDKISHLMPSTVYFIKVTNEVESGIPHTRGNAFVSPERRTSISTKLFFHQIFHILSRNQRDRRASLYGLIGFKPCQFKSTEIVDKYSVKNPEAPFIEFYLPVEINGKDSAVMSYLHTDKEGLDPNIKNGFDGHISGDLIEVVAKDGICNPVIDEKGYPKIHKHEEIPGFYDSVGRNTQFDIHPEEIVADNFAFLMMNIHDLPNPDIPEKIKKWLDY